jgi:hypothetical protein
MSGRFSAAAVSYADEPLGRLAGAGSMATLLWRDRCRARCLSIARAGLARMVSAEYL